MAEIGSQERFKFTVVPEVSDRRKMFVSRGHLSTGGSTSFTKLRFHVGRSFFYSNPGKPFSPYE